MITCTRLQHGRPSRRRLHQRQDRTAPRDRDGLQRGGGRTGDQARPGPSATQSIPPNVSGYDRENRQAGSTYDAAGARRCSTSSATSIATATAARGARRPAVDLALFVAAGHAGAPVGRAVAAQSGRGRLARRVRQAEVAGPAQDGTARAAADVAGGEHQRDSRKVSGSSGCSTASNAGFSNLPRFKLPEYDNLYERPAPLPDGPERDEADPADDRADRHIRAMGGDDLPLRKRAAAAVARRATSTTRSSSILGNISTST